MPNRIKMQIISHFTVYIHPRMQSECSFRQKSPAPQMSRRGIVMRIMYCGRIYSTVTLLARFLGLSISQPFKRAT